MNSLDWTAFERAASVSTFRLAQEGQQVRLCDHRFLPGPRQYWYCETARHVPWPIEVGVKDVARRSEAAPPGRIGMITMDGSTGFKAAAGDVIPQAVAEMDTFHVYAPAGDALGRCR